MLDDKAKKTDTRIIFFGTPEFALPALEALVKDGYDIAGVVTRPDERVGRKQILTHPPVKIAAERHHIPVFQPEKLDPLRFAPEIPAANLFIVAAYGRIIPKSILDMPRYGALNIHPSLLPRWRGPAPIQYAILSGDREAGVTIMKMDELMDHGPIVAQRSAPGGAEHAMYQKLHDELAELGAKLLIQVIPQWIGGKITPQPQDDSQATYSKILTKDDGRIDWSQPAREIERMTRAFSPWPGAWTLWPDGEKILRVRIEEASIIDEDLPDAGPGYVRTGINQKILVRCGRGSLDVKKIGVEGKKIIDANSFLRGYPSIVGSTLI